MHRAAIVMVIAWAALGLFGGHDSVGILSGTQPGSIAGLLLGLAYAAAWLAMVVLAPPLFVAGLVTQRWKR